MRIGVPREIKNHEYRVGLTPQSVAELRALGHQLWVETQAGAAIGFSDDDYAKAGARIAATAISEAWGQPSMMMKPSPAFLPSSEASRVFRSRPITSINSMPPASAQSRALP